MKMAIEQSKRRRRCCKVKKMSKLTTIFSIDKYVGKTDGSTCDPGCILKHVLLVPNTRSSPV